MKNKTKTETTIHEEKGNKKNHWLTATIILSLCLVGILTFNFFQEKQTEKQMLEKDGFRITKDNLNFITNEMKIRNYSTIAICSMEDKKCSGFQITPKEKNHLNSITGNPIAVISDDNLKNGWISISLFLFLLLFVTTILWQMKTEESNKLEIKIRKMNGEI